MNYSCKNIVCICCKVSKHHVHLKKWFEDVTSVVEFKDVLDVKKISFNKQNGNGNLKNGKEQQVETKPLKVLFNSLTEK